MEFGAYLKILYDPNKPSNRGEILKDDPMSEDVLRRGPFYDFDTVALDDEVIKCEWIRSSWLSSPYMIHLLAEVLSHVNLFIGCYVKADTFFIVRTV